MSKRGFITLAGGALVALPSAHAAVDVQPSTQTVRGVAVAEIPAGVTVSHNGRRGELRLLGSGVRKQLMFKVYEAAAYAPAGVDMTNPFATLIKGGFNIHLRLEFLRDTTGDKVRDAVESGFKGSHGADHKFVEPLELLLNHLHNGMKAGQVLGLTWVYGEGLTTQVEGGEALQIPGDGFARAVLEVWFGPKCVDQGLKRSMVRLVASEGN